MGGRVGGWEAWGVRVAVRVEQEVREGEGVGVDPPSTPPTPPPIVVPLAALATAALLLTHWPGVGVLAPLPEGVAPFNPSPERPVADTLRERVGPAGVRVERIRVEV